MSKKSNTDYIKAVYISYKEMADVYENHTEKREKRESFLKEYVNENDDIDESFEKEARKYYEVDFMVPAEMQKRAATFVMAIDFHKETSDEELEAGILSEYMKLKKHEPKSRVGVSKGKIIAIGEDADFSKQKFKEAFDIIKKLSQ